MGKKVKDFISENNIRLVEKIRIAANVYKEKFIGRHFLYIYENKHIEVLFKGKNFKHLTGVESNLSAGDFYKNAKLKRLKGEQIWFSKKHPYDLSKKKLAKLHMLDKLIEEDVFIIEDVKTETKTYKILINNLEFSLGLIENIDEETNQLIDNNLIPTTFRTKGEKDFDNNKNLFQVDFILSKDSCFKKYDNIHYGESFNLKSLPSNILTLIDEGLFDNSTNKEIAQTLDGEDNNDNK